MLTAGFIFSRRSSDWSFEGIYQSVHGAFDNGLKVACALPAVLLLYPLHGGVSSREPECQSHLLNVSLGRICSWKSAGRKNRNKALTVPWTLSFKGLRMAQKGLGWGVRGSAHLVCKGQYHCLCVHECWDLLACRPCINAYLCVQGCWDLACRPCVNACCRWGLVSGHSFSASLCLQSVGTERWRALMWFCVQCVSKVTSVTDSLPGPCCKKESLRNESVSVEWNAKGRKTNIHDLINSVSLGPCFWVNTFLASSFKRFGYAN